MEWIPRSPDLNPLGFYLWGYLVLKSAVYRGKSTTVHDIKLAIQAEIARIPRETWKAAIQNFK